MFFPSVRAHLSALMTRKAHAVGMHNTILRNHLKDVRAKKKCSNIDFFLKILPLKDDGLAMSEM